MTVPYALLVLRVAILVTTITSLYDLTIVIHFQIFIHFTYCKAHLNTAEKVLYKKVLLLFPHMHI